MDKRTLQPNKFWKCVILVLEICKTHQLEGGNLSLWFPNLFDHTPFRTFHGGLWGLPHSVLDTSEETPALFNNTTSVTLTSFIHPKGTVSGI